MSYSGNWYSTVNIYGLSKWWSACQPYYGRRSARRYIRRKRRSEYGSISNYIAPQRGRRRTASASRRLRRSHCILNIRKGSRSLTSYIKTISRFARLTAIKSTQRPESRVRYGLVASKSSTLARGRSCTANARHRSYAYYFQGGTTARMFINLLRHARKGYTLSGQPEPRIACAYRKRYKERRIEQAIKIA